jgi:hypothetical protein
MDADDDQPLVLIRNSGPYHARRLPEEARDCRRLTLAPPERPRQDQRL